MSRTIIGGFELGRLLHKEGMVPEECANIELLTPADGALQLRYTVNVRPEDLPKIARALTRLGEEGQ